MNLKKQIKETFPGLILCILLAQLSFWLGNIFPNIGKAPFAIFLGLFSGNTFAKSKLFFSGSKFSESDLLSYSIVLMGGTLSFKAILKVGFSGILFIVIQMLITILVAIHIGKKLGFSRKFQSLMAGGNAVCGSSAIGAIAPAINAGEDEKGISITIVNLTGTVLMFFLIPLSIRFFNADYFRTSAMLGGILQSVGQVAAAGSMINNHVQEMSLVFKMARIIFLALVVTIFAKRHKIPQNDVRYASRKIGFLKKIGVPWYITGFFILCILYSFGFISAEISKVFKSISSTLEIIALVGIGMRIRINQLLTQGPKAALYGIFIGVSQVFSALILIKLLF